MNFKQGKRKRSDKRIKMEKMKAAKAKKATRYF